MKQRQAKNDNSILSTEYRLEHIDIEINHQCNLKCKHCSARATSEKLPNQLTLSQIKSILKAAVPLGLEKVGLTGGEPLYDDDMLETLARYCVEELDIPVHTHTNGTLISTKHCSLDGVLTLFNSVSITFLGGDAVIHDAMTGVSGSFEKALNGTVICLENGIPLTCYYIPTHGTCHGFRDLTHRLSKMGITRIRAMALAPSGRARNTYLQSAPTEAELLEFQKDLLELGSEYGLRVEAGYCTRLSMGELAVLPGHGECMSGKNRIHINSRGDVFPCTAASGVEELRIGKLYDGTTLANIWHCSELLMMIRDVHKGRMISCRSCLLDNKCEASCIVRNVATLVNIEGCNLLSVTDVI